jgi:hypothetical protein
LTCIVNVSTVYGVAKTRWRRSKQRKRFSP